MQNTWSFNELQKKDLRATQSREFTIGAGTKIVVQNKGYLYTKYEQCNFYFIWYSIVMKYKERSLLFYLTFQWFKHNQIVFTFT
jgi:hypothetical protein